MLKKFLRTLTISLSIVSFYASHSSAMLEQSAVGESDAIKLTRLARPTQQDEQTPLYQASHTVETTSDASNIPWYKKTVSIRTLLLACVVSTAITLTSTLVPLKATIGDLEKQNSYLSCCSKMNYDVVADACGLTNTSNIIGGTCAPPQNQFYAVWCKPNVAPTMPGTWNKCSKLKYPCSGSTCY